MTPERQETSDAEGVKTVELLFKLGAECLERYLLFIKLNRLTITLLNAQMKSLYLFNIFSKSLEGTFTIRVTVHCCG